MVGIYQCYMRKSEYMRTVSFASNLNLNKNKYHIGLCILNFPLLVLEGGKPTFAYSNAAFISSERTWKDVIFIAKWLQKMSFQCDIRKHQHIPVQMLNMCYSLSVLSAYLIILLYPWKKSSNIHTWNSHRSCQCFLFFSSNLKSNYQDQSYN